MYKIDTNTGEPLVMVAIFHRENVNVVVRNGELKDIPATSIACVVAWQQRQRKGSMPVVGKVYTYLLFISCFIISSEHCQ